MRSRAGFFWCSLWLTLLLLLPLILVVGFLARQRQTQQELRQAAANQSQLQIEPGAQSVWRMLLVVQKEEPAFVLVRADGPGPQRDLLCPAGAAAGQRTGWHYHTGGMYAFGWGGAAAQLLRAALSTGETALPPLYYLGGHALLLGGLRGQRHGRCGLIRPRCCSPPHGWRWATARRRCRLSVPPTRWS